MASSENVQKLFDALFDSVRYEDDGDTELALNSYTYIRDKLLRDDPDLLKSVDDIEPMLAALDKIEKHFSGLLLPDEIKTLINAFKSERKKLIVVQEGFDRARDFFLGEVALSLNDEVQSTNIIEVSVVCVENGTLLLSDGTEYTMSALQTSMLHHLREGGWTRDSLIEQVKEEHSQSTTVALQEFRSLKQVLGSALKANHVDGQNELSLDLN